MFMIDLNFLNSIKSACIITNCRYVLLKMNYFSRFVWVKFYVHCTMIESTNRMNNHITSIFEWFKALYSNNEEHFVEYEFEKLLQTRKIIHFTTSVSHSSSIKLIERMIQLMIKEIRKRCIQRENSKAWVLNIIDETVIINIKKIRVNEHRSCDIMLNFISKIIHHDIKFIEQFIWKNEMKNLSDHEQRLMMILKVENRFLTLKTMIQYQNKKKILQKKTKNVISEDDLILIKNKVRDNQKKRKLDSRWKKFRMIMLRTKHELNVWTKSLYDTNKMIRHHITDIRSWVEKRKDKEWSTTQLINELSQHQDVDEDEENQLMIIIQTNDEIDSFRASLTFEMTRKAMIFADYSNQRSLLLWRWKRFWKCDSYRLTMSFYRISENAFVSTSFTRVFKESFIIKTDEHNYKNILQSQHLIFLTFLTFDKKSSFNYYLVITHIITWSNHTKRNMNLKKSDFEMKSERMKIENVSVTKK